jgi:hypothetical protein
MAAFANQTHLSEECEVEDGLVAHWRYEQSSRLGFSPDDALALFQL